MLWGWGWASEGTHTVSHTALPSDRSPAGPRGTRAGRGGQKATGKASDPFVVTRVRPGAHGYRAGTAGRVPGARIYPCARHGAHPQAQRPFFGGGRARPPQRPQVIPHRVAARPGRAAALRAGSAAPGAAYAERKKDSPRAVADSPRADGPAANLSPG